MVGWSLGIIKEEQGIGVANRRPGLISPKERAVWAVQANSGVAYLLG